MREGLFDVLSLGVGLVAMRIPGCIVRAHEFLFQGIRGRKLDAMLLFRLFREILPADSIELLVGRHALWVAALVEAVFLEQALLEFGDLALMPFPGILGERAVLNEPGILDRHFRIDPLLLRLHHEVLEVDRIDVVENHRAGEQFAIDHSIVTEAGLAVGFLDVAGVEIQLCRRLDIEGDSGNLGE